MAEVRNNWEGRTVNGVFPLRRFLGSSNHSSVFLTESSVEGFLNAAIKIVPADAAHSQLQLWQWKTAATFSHPNLMRLLDSGRCEIDGEPLLFVVMEYAEESLSQILPYRALGPDEVQELLVPTLDALAFLHNEKWIQGQLKPSNFLVVDDQLKLAVDTIRPIGVSKMGPRRPSIYDAPESDDGLVSVASDIWALGITMTEALTQYPPTWLGGRTDPPTFPTNLPAEFAETIHRCLSVKADDRPTVADLQRRTKPGEPQRQGATPHATPTQRTQTPPSPAQSSAPPLATTGAPPQTSLSQPFSASQLRQAPQQSVAQPAIVAPPVPPPPIPAPEMPMRADRPYSEVAEEQKRGALVPMLFALVVVGGAIWVGTKLLGRHVELPPATVSEESTAQDQNTSGSAEPAPEQHANSSSPATPSQRPGQTQSSASGNTGASSTPGRASSAERQPAPNSTARANSSSTRPADSAGPSGAIHEEIPNVSASSRSTIRGHVRVAVKVTVDSSGRVIHDVLDNASSSNYFNRVASEAARKWRFATADQGSREWVLRFEFGREGTTVKAVGPRS
ncbi:MAG: TonB family protein [Proteobacteria bacterium]|nr:TonB family protein [Pseudomonadota bacterium]